MTNRLRTTEVVLAAVLAVIFVLTGATKLAGIPMMVDQFADWSYPIWFMYVVGIMEIVGAGLLVSYRTRRFGAFLICMVMVGALATHVRVGQWSMSPLPLIILLAGLWLLRRRVEPDSPEEDGTDRNERETHRPAAIGTR